MFGVILWSDPDREKAVIWCEDHGQLAFYNDHSASILPYAYDVGDLVEFNVEELDDLRYASDLRLVSQHEYPTLAAALKRKDAKPSPETKARTMKVRAGSGQVIEFKRAPVENKLALAQ